MKTIFNTFEELLKNSDRCVSNMAFVARVLGERRICKLQATLVVGAPLQYTIYCAEHETISDSLGALVGVVSWSNLIGHFEFAACLCISIGHLCVFLYF